MSKRVAKPPRYEVRIARAARRDVAAVIKWSRREFGEDAALRYNVLLAQAFADIGEEPERLGARQRSELAEGVLVYHLAFSRDRARSPLGVVRYPRHLVVYRRSGRVIEVIRVLHDARDLKRHLAKEHRAGSAETE